MQELRIVLIIVGIVLIIALLAHGFWSSRKNRPEKLNSSTKGQSLDITSSKARDNQGFDDFGIGEVKVVGDPIDQHLAASEAVTESVSEPQLAEPVEMLSERHEPQLSAEPSPVLKTEPELNFSALDEEPSLAGVNAEPALSTSEPQAVSETSEPEVAEAPEAETAEAPQAPDDVFVINIMAQTHRKIKGLPLKTCLDTLGLHFGEMNIFHRHLDNAGTGPIVYSLANMVNPGTFDVDNMDKFETRGISLFMTVPCKGEPTKNFQSMYHSAQTLAKHLDALLLDDQRNPLTKQTVNHYEQRVREFERKQLLKAHAL